MDYMTPNIQQPKGKNFSITALNADHTYDIETRRSVNILITILNRTPIQWHIHSKNIAEASTHGLELAGIKIATEFTMNTSYTL